MQLGFGDTVRAWKVWEFIFLRLFEKAILSPKFVLKYQPKAFMALADPSLLSQRKRKQNQHKHKQYY